MSTLNADQLIALVLASFEAERTHNIDANLKLISKDFRFTDMTLNTDGTPFVVVGGQQACELMKVAFPIKNREFIFISICADENTQKVIVEFIESYPDPANNKEFRTPQVAVCEIKDGLIHRTRHYMDPRISYLHLSEQDINKAYK